jgi:hypothetical protein
MHANPWKEGFIMQSTRSVPDTLQDSKTDPARWPPVGLIQYRPRTREDWQREHEEFFAWIETQPDLAAAHRAGRALDLASGEDQRQARAQERALQREGLLPLPGTWWGHLMWLHREFGDRPFTTGQVCGAGFDDPEWASPPGHAREDLIGSAGARQLGKLYAGVARRVFEGAWIDPGPVTHGVRRWTVTVKSEN